MKGWIVLTACVVIPATMGEAAPLRLADGRPLVCVYYFGHWWEPWRSDEGVIRRDLARLKQMGVSVLALDHEWSQAIDGNWKWLDRKHRLAQEAGLQILPWLSLKVWSDLSDPGRRQLIHDWYGVDLALGMHQDGSAASVQIWDEATLAAGAAYARQYLERYRDQALLHVTWNGQLRPVIALSVELAWDGGFDDATGARFIAWLKERYQGSLAALNQAWGTDLASFESVNPRDRVVFDYEHLQEGTAAHPAAVEDHIEFRSQVISQSLG